MLIDRPGDDPIIGILLFRPGHEEAAQRMPADDPLIKAGRLRAEFMRWYGPAGLTYTGDPGPNAELEAELAEAAASAAASR